MLDYKHPVETYEGWFEVLKDYIENNYVGTLVEIEESKSGLLYESFEKLYDEDYVFSVTICINSSLCPRTKLYALLHEAGHLERMWKGRGTKTFFYNYLDAAPDNMKFRTRTVVEEVLAWYKAENLADELNIKLEVRPWQREVEKAIQLYTLWCAEKRE